MSLKINVEESVVSKIKVKADPALNNLCALRLVNVSVNTVLSEDSKDTYEYKGFNIPNLTFEFEQDHSDGIPRFLTYSVGPVVSIKTTGEPNPLKIRESIYLAQYSHVRHIYDAFLELPNAKPLKDLKLPAFKVDSATIEKHLQDLNKWYDAMLLWFTDVNNKPVYLNAKGDAHKLIAKLIINKNSKTIDIPNYINDGFIEIMKFNKNKLVTGLEIKPNEAVTFQNVALPGMASPAGIAGAPTGTVNFDEL